MIYGASCKSSGTAGYICEYCGKGHLEQIPNTDIHDLGFYHKIDEETCGRLCSVCLKEIASPHVWLPTGLCEHCNAKQPVSYCWPAAAAYGSSCVPRNKICAPEFPGRDLFYHY